MAAASRNNYVLKHTIRFFSSRSGKEGFGGAASSSVYTDDGDELDESDIVWPSHTSVPTSLESSAVGMRRMKPVGVRSPPVSIPEWSVTRQSSGEAEEEEEEVVVVPPHVMMWRRRAQSLSVVEGAGRTLKGRDLSRVRNAVWAKTGFQD
ncbi:hypothetical protein HPP92_002281 [Vanilla planifolia]|uniref:Senescence regulator n=1 Tax=Vanilla planifolia TaxID=51239 RepID=A0A835VIT8_VANPL|nr:hypothetical protein HPP92_002281 [Vanilla planifolia]